MGITWGPFKEFGSAAKAFGETEATRKRQKMLDRVKVLADLRRAGYQPTDMQDMAIDVEGLGKFEPVSEMSTEEKAYRRTLGSQKARKDLPVPPQPTLSEREREATKAATIRLQRLAEKDPNIVYSKHGYKVNDDGTLYLDPVHHAPVKLPPFPDVLGKRTNLDVIRRIGEQWDDAQEIVALIQDPEVIEALTQGAKETGGTIWDSVANKVSNTFKLWLQKKGVGKASKVNELITRMQRFASQERKEFLGVAVTATELESVLAWMPNAGDSFEEIWNKARVASFEAEEQFRRFLDMYKNIANMGPVYDAFGIKRFPTSKGPTMLPMQPPSVTPKTAWILNPNDPSGPPIQVWSHGLDEQGQEIWDTEPPRP